MKPLLLSPMPRQVKRLRGTCRPETVSFEVEAAEFSRRVRDARVREQAYRLRAAGRQVEISAGGGAGAWYALQTLGQLVQVHGERLPAVEIVDWPDFAVRGVMLDISRDKVLTMRTLKMLIDKLASWKINQLQLYTEHTFAYRRHRTVWKDASPITPAEARELDAYCRKRFIELVPNQNCFGHMERWLKHKRYRGLAETTGAWRDPWGGTRNYATTLCPGDPKSIRLVEELLGELLPNFASGMVNVGCDETFELGQGRSRAKTVGQASRLSGTGETPVPQDEADPQSESDLQKRHVGRVYLDFLLKIHRVVRGHGRRMQFWADIIHEHPELIRKLPRDAIPLEWGYEADHPFDARCRALAKAGLEFYVCPGTSTWCSFAGRTDNALANLRNAAKAGAQHGASGYLITDWGDYGHRQYLAASYLPFLYGASVSWCLKSNAGQDAAMAASMFAFGDRTGVVGRGWFDLGNAYRAAGPLVKNQSILFRALQAEFASVAGAFPSDRQEIVRRLLEQMLAGMGLRLGLSRRYADFDLPALEYREFLATADVLFHACSRVLAAIDDGPDPKDIAWLMRSMRGIMKKHRRLWLRRNRPGGLKDSLAHYERNLAEYRALARK